MATQPRFKGPDGFFPPWFFFFAIWLCVAFYATHNKPAVAAEAPGVSPACATHHFAPLLKFKIIRKYPHDPEAFTQGLLFANGFLYESTGLNGRSSLRKVALKTGRVLKEYDLPPQYFGEGLALWDGSLIQLTWLNGIAFEYNSHSFALERKFRYPGQGWGLTNDKKSLIMSNGSSKLLFIDPATFTVQRSVRVLDMGRPVRLLNELEYINGQVFANVWHEDYIARISPKTGEVTGWLDLRALRSQLPPSAKDLNGIAYDPEKDRIFITGKLWPFLYEIKLTKR
ncbi:MAG: glutaminyl-peptide cyclotransferase [Deltaproteobacteria bacterium]|jgi:glutamine cyclotransferase|nr:glutaminyl-peptide cyclotransferase [Deltaproteobacteria bacterium]